MRGYSCCPLRPSLSLRAPVDEQHRELHNVVVHGWLYTAMAGPAPAAPNPGGTPRQAGGSVCEQLRTVGGAALSG